MGRERTERRNNGSVIKSSLIPVAIAAVIIAGAIFFINSGIGQKGESHNIRSGQQDGFPYI